MYGRSRGFTLVEMSIVLVIIGLIIGGILKGQEIIASARQKAVINQVNAIRSATTTYFDRYHALPGDDPNAATRIDPNLNNGDGNGIIGTGVNTTATLASTVENSGENYIFFNALVATQLLGGGTETSTNSGGSFGTTALPAGAEGGTGFEVIYGEHKGNTTTNSDVTQNWIKLIKNAGAPAAALYPKTLANIDTISDDGLPDTGEVRGDDTAGCQLGGGTLTSTYGLNDQVDCIGLFGLAND